MERRLKVVTFCDNAFVTNILFADATLSHIKTLVADATLSHMKTLVALMQLEPCPRKA
ncbi:hypothetical protein ACQKII_04165 [Lysinibacillus sp. NPDC048646]|uniref:hypothetical protein n=1 Tax=Lysinibacillus sp. NPDC048646 TaxID=3390574 RepID=UPI003D022A73